MRLFLVLIALVLYVATGFSQPVARPGIVHGNIRSFVDDDGPFLARGASLFWALWAYDHDRDRLARNLSTLRDWGFHYVRVLGVIGAPGDRRGPVCGSGESNCDTWRDRRTEPDGEAFPASIAGFTDWAYQEFGLRTQWTIFGGTELTPTVESRKAVVERFASMAMGREHEIFAFEIANEAFKNGFDGAEGRAELHSLAALLKTKTQNLVALSSPAGSNCAGAQELYKGSAADFMTLHVGRAGDGDQFWRSLREIWSLQSCANVPSLVASNEPVGPESSVVSQDDPLALTGMSSVTYLSGLGAVVFHSGPGVRGGGEADRALGRRSNLWELPTGKAIAGGLDRLSALLPADVANWAKVDATAGDSNRPLDVSDRNALSDLFCATRGADFVCTAVGINRPVVLTARRNLRVRVESLLHGSSEPADQVIEAGKSLELAPSTPAVVLRGRL